MNTFVVQHIHTFDDDSEDTKFIGVYSSQEQAEQACERLKKQPGFQDTPSGFTITPYIIDQDHWTEGYIPEYITDQEEQHITAMFFDLTADLVSLRCYEPVLIQFFQAMPGKWHVIQEICIAVPALQERIQSLYNTSVNMHVHNQDSTVYMQWLKHPTVGGHVIITFYMDYYLLFRNAIYNTDRLMVQSFVASE